MPWLGLLISQSETAACKNFGYVCPCVGLGERMSLQYNICHFPFPRHLSALSGLSACHSSAQLIFSRELWSSKCLYVALMLAAVYSVSYSAYILFVSGLSLCCLYCYTDFPKCCHTNDLKVSSSSQAGYITSVILHRCLVLWL